MPSTKQITAVQSMYKQMGKTISYEDASKMTDAEVQAVFKEANGKGMKSFDEERAILDKQNEAISKAPVGESLPPLVVGPSRPGETPPTDTKLTVQSGIVMPAVSTEEAVKAWGAYLDLKKKIATKEDTQIIQGREFFKKSYWRKLATFFNLSVEVVEEREEGTEKNRIYHFICKATAPNGRFAQGAGTCDQLEKGRKNTIHNTRSTAETRAFNRAVSNLVGGGEVSAEEMGAENNPPKATSNPRIAKATMAQQRKIFAIAKQAGMDTDTMKEWVKKRHGIDSFTKLNIQQAKETIDALEKRLVEMVEKVYPAEVVVE